MDYYKNILMDERSEYKISAQSYIHMEGKDVNIGIRNVERAIMFLKNGRMCGPEGICLELLKDGTEKLYRILNNINF